jgi:PAS domain S-box-containing protein
MLDTTNLDMRQILDQTIDGVVTIGPDNHVTYFNAAAERLWGYAASEVIGQNVKMLIPQVMRGDHDAWVDRHRKDSIDRIVGSSREVQMERKDGHKLWVSLSLSEVKAGSGQSHYTAFVRDISEQRNARTLVEQTLEQTIDAVVTIDEHNIVTFFNAAAEKLWGYRRAEVIGQNVKMLVPPEMQGNHDGFVNRHRETEENRIVGKSRIVPIHRKNGSVAQALLSLSRIAQDGGGNRYTAFLKDMTVDRQKTEETLAVMHAMLKEISDATKGIESVAKQTNLLSVNATIEAARAGDTGRGFAVVAVEIRKLSDQVRDITQRISSVAEKGQEAISELKSS